MSANSEVKTKFKESLIRACKYTIILLAFLALILGVPFLINLLYKLPAPIECLSTAWRAEDALSYYGAILTFLGTSILSILALIQNRTINQLNLQHTMLLEQMEKDKHAPFFVAKYVSGGPLAENLTIALRNISENVAQQVTISECKVIDDQEELPQNIKPLTKEYICAHQEVEFKLNNAALPQRTSLIHLSICYQDLFGELYRYKAVGSFLGKNDNMVFTVIKEGEKG